MNRHALLATTTLLTGTLAVALAAAGPVSGQEAPGTTSEAAPPPDDPPNIVFVVTDDMARAEMPYMPHVQRLIGNHGTTFSHATSPFPLCCPARATMLTGQYAHNHGVLGNASERVPRRRLRRLRHRRQHHRHLDARRGLPDRLRRQVPQRLRQPGARAGAAGMGRLARHPRRQLPLRPGVRERDAEQLRQVLPHHLDHRRSRGHDRRADPRRRSDDAVHVVLRAAQRGPGRARRPAAGLPPPRGHAGAGARRSQRLRGRPGARATRTSTRRTSATSRRRSRTSPRSTRSTR